jgi:hypothetical protein
MTAYEIADVLASATANSYSGMGQLVSFVTAYLAAAYLVGNKFSIEQLLVVNVAFTIAWFLNSVSLIATTSNIMRLIDLQGNIQLAPTGIMLPVMCVFVVLLIIGPFFFMWTVRNGDELEVDGQHFPGGVE